MLPKTVRECGILTTGFALLACLIAATCSISYNAARRETQLGHVAAAPIADETFDRYAISLDERLQADEQIYLVEIAEAESGKVYVFLIADFAYSNPNDAMNAANQLGLRKSHFIRARTPMEAMEAMEQGIGHVLGQQYGLSNPIFGIRFGTRRWTVQAVTETGWTHSLPGQVPAFEGELAAGIVFVPTAP